MESFRLIKMCPRADGDGGSPIARLRTRMCGFGGDGLVRNGGNGRKAKGQDLAVAGRG
jgi:hypothetical protein